ncbi:spartin isoform X2 [Nematostella vectensis]|uniref:spartin isoform X2 n=1 Tax=Nematostella vectensis TaxID=45351 RepID=UPI00138FC45F|nr:spartin isoform X2 [Nematostella vectensis]
MATKTDDAPAKIKSYHDEGFRYINQGLECDEKGKNKEALQLYRKGVRSLVTGSSIYCRGSGKQYDDARQKQEKMKLAKEQVEERISALSSLDRASTNSSAKTGPPGEVEHATPDNGMWEDVNELLVLENVKMFFVSEQGHVTTISQPQTLRAYQFIMYEEGCEQPPAFLQCSGWMFPMIPKRSPVLNTEPHTYMFPDITISASKSVQRPGSFASVGLILNPETPSSDMNRFERILRCYTDYHHYTPTPDDYQEIQAVSGTNQPAEYVASKSVAARPLPGAIRGQTQTEEEKGTWGEKVSKGILVGAELIAWGLMKGAQVGSHLVYKGGIKIRQNLRPNESPTEVDEKVQENIRHVKSVAGAACQVSGAVVAAVGALTAELGRRLAPVVIQHGAKVLPDSVKSKTDNEKGEKVMQEAVKVAVTGAHGFASIYQSLETSWRMLYTSLQLATVETVDHKYGPAVGEATNNSMGALGFALQTAWNVDNLGVKALAKRTAKDTGKHMIKEAEKRYIVSADDQLARQ